MENDVELNGKKWDKRKGKTMENIKLALITADRDYGRALGLALVEVYKNFTVTLYQSTPVHNELDRVDLVLMDTADDTLVKHKMIQLVEKQSQTDKDFDEKRFRLYKYSNVRQLAGELLFLYTFLTGRKAVPMRNGNARIIVFGAPEGGSGCTTAAMAFAQEFRRFHGKKVIYISLEEIESTLEYMRPFKDGNSISDYLYYLFNDKDTEHFPFLESFTVMDDYGVEAFMPSPGRNVLKTLSPEEMQYFVSAVMDTGNYDVVVIDASSNLDKAALTCYEMANRIFFVTRADRCEYKTERFLEYVTFVKGEKVVERMENLQNFHTGEDVTTESILPLLGLLPQDLDSFELENGVRSIRPEGAYGKRVKELALSVMQNITI